MLTRRQREMDHLVERENLKKSLLETQKILNKKTEECAVQRGQLLSKIEDLEKENPVTARTQVETERVLRESIDNILTDRVINTTFHDDLNWYRENFENHEDQVGNFFVV